MYTAQLFKKKNLLTLLFKQEVHIKLDVVDNIHSAFLFFFPF